MCLNLKAFFVYTHFFKSQLNYHQSSEQVSLQLNTLQLNRLHQAVQNSKLYFGLRSQSELVSLLTAQSPFPLYTLLLFTKYLDLSLMYI